MTIRIGCAGWSIAGRLAEKFPGDGSHLERYAQQFNCVEINSSFYRPHQQKTYVRWAASTPSEFRFSVKMPKRITHEARLIGVEDELARFSEEVAGLGAKLGVILVQLPPSLAFDALVANGFLGNLRQRFASIAVALEPRHSTWFESAAETVMANHGIARVAADPPPVPGATVPAGSPQTVYYRLHGSPRIYYSAYDTTYLAALAGKLTKGPAPYRWCIFDNTALAAATENALELRDMLQELGTDRTSRLLGRENPQWPARD